MSYGQAPTSKLPVPRTHGHGSQLLRYGSVWSTVTTVIAVATDPRSYVDDPMLLCGRSPGALDTGTGGVYPGPYSKAKGSIHLHIGHVSYSLHSIHIPIFQPEPPAPSSIEPNIRSTAP
jgi:hypothetical protein